MTIYNNITEIFGNTPLLRINKITDGAAGNVYGQNFVGNLIGTVGRREIDDDGGWDRSRDGIVFGGAVAVKLKSLGPNTVTDREQFAIVDTGSARNRNLKCERAGNGHSITAVKLKCDL